jgi:hypothetical protein
MKISEIVTEGKTGPGLWANIHAKQERIKHGSGERMRKPGSKGAPTAKNFRDAANEGREMTDDEANKLRSEIFANGGFGSRPVTTGKFKSKDQAMQYAKQNIPKLEFPDSEFRIYQFPNGTFDVAEENLFLYDNIEAGGGKLIGKITKQGVAEGSEEVDTHGRTKAEWVKAVHAKYPMARVIYSKDNTQVMAVLPNGKEIRWIKDEGIIEQDVAEGWDPDTTRLEQDVRDALENGDDYTAKQYAKMAPTPEAKKYLLNIIKQAMYIDDLGGETDWKGVTEAGEWTKLPNGNWRNMHTGAQQSTPPKTKKPRKSMGLHASLEQHADDKMKELGHKFKGNYDEESRPIKDDGNEGRPGKQRYPGMKEGVAEEAGTKGFRVTWSEAGSDKHTSGLLLKPHAIEHAKMLQKKPGTSNVKIVPYRQVSEMDGDSSGRDGSNRKRMSSYGTRDRDISGPDVHLDAKSAMKRKDIVKRAASTLNKAFKTNRK